MQNIIIERLPRDFPWKNSIYHFQSVDSTNTLAKNLAAQGAPHGTVLIADAQTGGRGRMGRSFHSPAGSGIYFSVILRPQCQATQLMHLTCAAAVATCRALESACGLKADIKWTNDLVFQKKKLGGILTELSIRPDGTVAYAIVGIGINCTQQPQDFPEDIRSIATSLSMATGRAVSGSTVATELILALEEMTRSMFSNRSDLMDSYRKRCITLGEYISVRLGDSVRYGTAIDIDDEGALLVAFADGHTETVNAGEVSIRGMYGYI